MRVILGENCVCGVVGPYCTDWLPLVGMCVFVDLNDLGWFTVERESRVDGEQACVFGLVPE